MLGTRSGITYGRWTDGPADTLSITFDLSAAGPVMQGYPGFRALVERAGKAWSHRIADTWAAWRRHEGELKGWLIDGPDSRTRVHVGAGGGVSAGLEIDIRDDDIAGNFAGWANNGHRPPGESWEPRFAPLEIDRDYLREYPRDAGESALFATLAHEIGHTLGAWQGGPATERYDAFTDTEAGMWTGPDGRRAAWRTGAVPGRIRSGCLGCGRAESTGDTVRLFPQRRVRLAHGLLQGQRPTAGVRAARHRLRLPRRSRHDRDRGHRHARDLRACGLDGVRRIHARGVARPSNGPGGRANPLRALVPPQPATAGRHRSLPGGSGRVRPPKHRQPRRVLSSDGSAGDGALRGRPDRRGHRPRLDAAGHRRCGACGRPRHPRRHRELHLARGPHRRRVRGLRRRRAPLSPSRSTETRIVGTDASSTLLADFHGPRHEDAAGTLHDPDAGLLASFGTTFDDRPGREAVVASADHLSGLAWWSGGADPAGNGWVEYRCGANAGSGCEGRDEAAGRWGDWTPETRASVLAATAGWNWRGTAKSYADHDFARIARQTVASAGGGQGSHAADGYTGALEHVAFGTGFEMSADPRSDFGMDILDVWSGVQGAASGGIPAGSARWSGLMLGYRHGEAADDDPFVEGLASVEYSLPTSDLAVAFSEVATRDGRRRLADFGFEDTPLQADGTFVADGGSGSLRGVLFGPAQEEAAGTFHHNAARVTGSFGAVRLPDPAPGQAATSAAARALDVHLDGTRHVGVGVAPEADALASAGDRNGVAVSSGEVQDGASAERVIEYLAEQTRGGGHRFGRNATGLATFAERPTLRLARGTSEDLVAYTMRAVQVINAALPADRRIVIGSDPAPPGAAIGNVPDGQIFVDFTPSADDGNLEDVDPGHRYFQPTTYVDPNAEYDSVAQRWEERSMRAARVWADGRDFMALLRTVWVWNDDVGVWETEVLDSPVVETSVVRKYYSEEFGNALMVRPLLQAMGFLGYLAHDRFPDSFLAYSPEFDTLHLPAIDGDALLAAYGRLEPGTEPEDLSPESLGPWSDTSFHLRGDMAVAGGRAAFGVALRNGLARPWAFGPEPLASLADNTALYGTATWNGALAGITPAEETVAGNARLAVELATLEGQLDFTGLERWGVRAAPGASGSGTTWGDGDLGYSIQVEGNALVQTGGDEGEVTGVFFGRAHEAMGGVLLRSDLSAAFGGTR